MNCKFCIQPCPNAGQGKNYVNCGNYRCKMTRFKKLKQMNIECGNHKARKITKQDYEKLKQMNIQETALFLSKIVALYQDYRQEDFLKLLEQEVYS